MAAVYRARDLSLDRDCAVKVLHRHLQSDRESRLRFQREAQAVARLRHPNILEIYAYSVDEADDSYLVAEFIDGPTLRVHLTGHPPRFPEVGAMVGCEVLRALAVAHREGVIHRDIKPENIMIRRDGSVVLCDFGIARLADKDNVTTTGQLLGSPAYMAPEHIKGQRVDSRSDLFSLGTVMYELITGALPFRGQNPHDTLVRIAAGDHVPVHEQAPLCSPQLSRVVERALLPDPNERYQDTERLREDLEEALADSGIAPSEVASQLAAYFKDPTAWEAAFGEGLRTRLVAEGRSLLRGGRTAAALSVWARAQILAPKDKEVLMLLGSVTRRRKRRRLAAYCAGFLATVTVLGLVGQRVWQQRRMTGGRLPGPLVMAPSAPPAEPKPDDGFGGGPLRPMLTGRPQPGAESISGAAELGPSRTGPEPPSRLRPAAGIVGAVVRSRSPDSGPAPVVRLEPWPKAVRVTHNGRVLGVYGTEVRSVRLASGPNVLVFENPACYTERVELPPGQIPTEVRVRLRWKPALLLVRAVTGSDAVSLTADVLVDGRLAGRTGQVVALPIQGDESSRTIDLQVSAPGHRSATRSLLVRANQSSQVDVTLPPL